MLFKGLSIIVEDIRVGIDLEVGTGLVVGTGQVVGTVLDTILVEVHIHCRQR